MFSDQRIHEDNFSSCFGQGLTGSVPERHAEEFLHQKALCLLVRIREVTGVSRGGDRGEQLRLRHRVSNAHLSLEDAADNLYEPCKSCLSSFMLI